ncbi:MAG TPA: hypothetical protein PLN15_01515 [Bacilli bacterium]|nr:hypothetical protein [Bacilli bacterium]
MKNKAFSFFFLITLLTAGCAPTADSSSAPSFSEDPVYDAYYRAENQELTYYDVSRSGGMDSLPTVGEVNLLVVPVIIEGYEENASVATRNNIQKVMFGQSEDTSWESVASFYDKSSYGRLTLTGEVTPWFPSGYSAAEMNAMEARGQDSVSLLLEDAVDWLREEQTTVDLTAYDNDRDGHLDAVWMIYSAPSQISDVFWAFVNWNYRNLNNKNIANPTPFTHAWASFDFMYEGYGTSGIDAHTYIHETGHLLGLDDYYDYDGKTSPMGMIDMMDYNIIDHNGFSKFALGWTNPYIVTGDADINLLPASSSGQSILLTADWNGNPFDEYLLLELYTPDGLNEKDALNSYPANGKRGFTIPGIRMYHADARLFDSETNTYVDDLSASEAYVGASNSPSWSYLKDYKSKFKLLHVVDAAKNIRYMSSQYARANDDTLFTSDMTFSFEEYKTAFARGSNLLMNDGTTFPFTIEFSEVSAQGATIKIRVI